MNRTQAWLLGMGVAVLLGVLLFPPWLAVSKWADGHEDADEVGRHCVLAAPKPGTVVPELRHVVEAKRQAGAILYSAPDAYVVDWARQIVPLSIATAVVLCGLVLLRDRGQL